MAIDSTSRLIIQAINNASPVIRTIQGDLGVLKTVAAAVAAYIGTDFVKGFVEANSELDRMKRAFDAIAGAGVGKLEYDRLTETANKLGLSLESLTSSYTQLKAASIGTAMEGKNADDAFKSVAGAMSVLGANTNQTKNAFLAISQMVSKGTVSMEELRRQLAQHLPGAIQIFARALNVSTAQLYKLVKAGQVGIPEMIKFFDQINKEYNPEKMKVSTYEQNTARLENAFKSLYTEIGATGAWQAVTNAVGATAGVVNRAADSIQGDAIAMTAVWDSWGSQFTTIIEEADDALNGFLGDLNNNTADSKAVIYAIGESFKFVGEALANLPANIKAATVILVGEIGQALVSIKEQFDLLWNYAGTSADAAFMSIKVAFQSVIASIDGMLANMAGTMATSLESLGKSGQFIPGFQASLNGVAQGLRDVETGAKESAQRLDELQKAEQGVENEGNKRSRIIQDNADRERDAWQGVIDQTLQARDEQVKAQKDLIQQRQQSAAYDSQEQALWAQRVENIKQVTAAIAEQGVQSKSTKGILAELAKMDGETGNKNKNLRLSVKKVQDLSSKLNADSSESAKQDYLNAYKMAEIALSAAKKTGAYYSALRALKAERSTLENSGVLPKDSTNIQNVDADTSEAKKKLEILREEINGVTTFTQVDANVEAAKTKVSEMIQWVNSQKATINVTTNSGAKPQGYATGGLVGGYGNSDSVRALLTPGEYVLTKSVVQQLGIPYLNSLGRKRSVDNLHIPQATRRYASGGLVESNINHVIELKIGGNSHKVAVTSRDAVTRLRDDMIKFGRTL